MKDVIGVIALVVYLAMLATLVKSQNTSKISSSLWTGFDGSLKAAEGG